MTQRARRQETGVRCQETPDLTIHPTAIALRQFQRRALERHAFFDGRRHISLSAFLNACAEAALAHGAPGTGPRPTSPLRAMTDLDRELAIVEAAACFHAIRRPETAFLRDLAPTALEETLAQLIDTMAPLADRAGDFLALLAADRRRPKNPALAALYAAYVEVCQALGVADDARVNAAILAVLRGDRGHWPACLRHARTVTFAAVRWVAPFQESVIAALAAQLGPANVCVRHILTDYEQDWWGESLLTNAGQLLFGDAQAAAEDCRFQPPATRSAIEHLTGLREGYAMQDRSLAEQARARAGFSCSVGTYGEIEDLARRIAWELFDCPDPVRPEDICLVTRDLGAASDAIVDVFGRFDIPYYFRRGIPVLAVPAVKTLLNLARFSADRKRDTFCALLESPWLQWGVSSPSFDPATAADDLLRSGVEPIMDAPDRLARRLATFYREEGRHGAPGATEAVVRDVLAVYRAALGTSAVSGIDAALADLLARSEALGLRRALAAVPPAADGLERRTAVLNAKALETALNTIGMLRRHALADRQNGRGLTWSDVVDLLTRALRNVTVAPAPPDESGVWILNPYDAAGLRFEVVLLAGLNAGAFPQPPAPSPLFPDAELLEFRERLGKRGSIPVAALAGSRSRNSQENLLFLTTLAAARERLVFSHAAHDETGQEQPPSVFFSTMWRLVGWPAWDPLPAAPPDPYDAWRLSAAAGHLQSHWQKQIETRATATGPLPALAPFRRRPFPGESYLGAVPPPLCRADDERWQWATSHPDTVSAATAPAPTALATHVVHGIRVEHGRQAFFARQTQTATPAGATPADLTAAPGHEYAGILDRTIWAGLHPVARDGVPDFSPTQLERLVACPYQYYLHHVLHVEPVEPNELEPRAQDFGTAVHAVMCSGFRILQGRPPLFDIASLKQVAHVHRSLVHPAWAVSDPKGAWRLQESPEQPSVDALSLVDFRDGCRDDYLAFFDAVTETMLAWATGGNAIWMLGAPEQLNVQRRSIRRAVRNLVRAALDPEALPDLDGLAGCRRLPALLEYTFDSRGPHADGPSLELTDPSSPGRKLRLHGKIDRVDLVFGPDSRLRAAIVVDYKGSSQATRRPADLAAGMAAASDCQLAAYGLAVQSQISNLKSQISDLKSQISDLKSQIPVLAHYLSYTQTTAGMLKQCRDKWMALDGRPLDDDALRALLGANASLAEAFAAAAFAALRRYEQGAFAVAPRECAYCDLKACCRHAANVLPKDADTAENGA